MKSTLTLNHQSNSSMTYKVLLLPGDHVGPEVIGEAVKILNCVSESNSGIAKDIKLQVEYEIFGGASIDKHGVAVTSQVLDKAKGSDAILMGSVGGPEWASSAARPEQGVLDLRKTLNCWANIRPCKFPSEDLVKLSVIKEHVVRGTDFIVLRENCGGAYFGDKVETADYASDMWGYSRPEVERITRMAAYLACNSSSSSNGKPSRITSCDKANVLANSRLWRKVVQETHDKEFPEIPLVHQLADSATVVMMKNPRALNGVVLCDNTFGDILSDEAAVIPGSLGLLPSASLASIPDDDSTKDKSFPGLYEPSHGSAPDLDANKVNPVATILSVALMFRYSFGSEKIAQAIEKAVKICLDDKVHGGLEIRTGDLLGNASTSEMGDAITSELKKILESS